MIPNTMPDPHRAREPSSWIVRFAHLVPAGARVLDLACGHGRHARFFADRACRVLAVDNDAVALASLEGCAGIVARDVDLEGAAWPLGDERFDAIVVTNYLYRPRFPDLIAAIADDGVLLYETFARGNEAHGRPASPDHLLLRGELLARVHGRLEAVAFEEGRVSVGTRDAVMQRLAAVGTGRAWPSPLAAD